MAINARVILSFFVCFLLCSCTIYTEKRSEALSQAVFAASDSIGYARFDLAAQYSKQAEKLAFPPKTRIKINPVYTPSIQPFSGEVERKKKVIVKIKDELTSQAPTTVSISSVLTKEESLPPTLRLVIPEQLKHAKLLIENSTEWKDLIQTKEFSNKLQEDYAALQQLSQDVNKELQRQHEMNSKMVSDLKDMQKKLVEKDLAILKRNILIASLIIIMCGGVYLRVKGIF